MGSFDLTTASKVKSFEGITVSGDDTLIGVLIERVSKLFDSHTGRKLFARDYDYASSDSDLSEDAILNGLNNPINRTVLQLPQFPLNTVTTVRINESEIDESTGIFETGWYIHHRRQALLGLRGREWTGGAQNTELVYNAGYVSGSIPEDLEGACVEQVLWVFKQGKKEHLMGFSGKTLADGSISILRSGHLLPSVVAVLRQYKVIR